MQYNQGSNYVQSARNSTMAIVSLIAGILGLSIFPVLGSLIAVVTGHMAKNEIRSSNGLVTGDGLALAGLVLGYIGLGLTVLGICAVILWFIFVAGMFGLVATQSSQALPLALWI